MWQNVFRANAQGRPLGSVSVCRRKGVIRRCDPVPIPFVNRYQIDGRIPELPCHDRGIGPLIDFFRRTDLQDFPLGQNRDAIPH